MITSSHAAAHSPVEPDSHDSLALSMAVSTADLSVVCEQSDGQFERCQAENRSVGLQPGDGGKARGTQAQAVHRRSRPSSLHRDLAFPALAVQRASSFAEVSRNPGSARNRRHARASAQLGRCCVGLMSPGVVQTLGGKWTHRRRRPCEQPRPGRCARRAERRSAGGCSNHRASS